MKHRKHSLLQVALESDAYRVIVIKPCEVKLHVYGVSNPDAMVRRATQSTGVEIPSSPIV